MGFMNGFKVTPEPVIETSKEDATPLNYGCDVCANRSTCASFDAHGVGYDNSKGCFGYTREMKRCPFCASKASIDRDYEKEAVTLRCNNKECMFNLTIKKSETSILEYEDFVEKVIKWYNKRG